MQQGFALHQQGNLNEAKALYERTLALDANHFDALQLLGALMVQIEQFSQAAGFLSKALQLKPQHVACCINHGLALRSLGRLDEALISYNQVLSIEPNFAESYSTRGLILQGLKRLDKALLDHDKAIGIKPDYAEAHSNRGLVLHELKRLDEALASYDQAINIKPDFADAHWNLSLSQLLTGNFKEGWQEYEWRWKAKNISKNWGFRAFPEPLWLGAQSLQDKTILLYAEQGLGDTMQFCRYASLVAKLGAKVILEVQRPLLGLLKNLEGVSQVIARGDALPDFDYQCPLLSLPLAFKTELHTIPSTLRYLAGDSEKVSAWQVKLGEKIQPRIGLVWSGSVEHANDHNRSLALSQILPYLPSGCQYICLQKELRSADRAILAQHTQIQYFGDVLEDFTDTAALCELMDVVISVDTSVAHLAAALGKPTWVLLPFSPDWRWLLGREESPWYPSAKLYRQEKMGDWNGVLSRVRVGL